MNNLFQYIGKSNLFSKIKINDIIKQFKYEQSDSNDNNLEREKIKPLIDTSGNLFWQNYPPSLAFARNFFVNNKNYCIHISSIIKEMQNNFIPTSDISEIFKREKIIPERVNLMRVNGNVQTHRDYTRDYSLTIGLLNCNNYKTYVIPTQNPKHCDGLEKYYYQVKKNQVYITNVSNAHGVELINNSTPCERYVLTYNLFNKD